MENSLSSIAKLILKDDYFKFENFISEYNSDIVTFKNKHKKLLLRWIDKEDFEVIEDYLSFEYLFEIYANSVHRMFNIDWSGEEYPGQLKGTLTKILKILGAETFKWSLKEFELSIDFSELKKGDYIALLFKAFDKELEQKGYRLLFIEMYDDEYHYTILEKDKMKNALLIKGKNFETYDSKLYEIYITNVGKSKSKVMLYLKSKHKIELTAIKSYIENLPIEIGKGYLPTIRKLESELKDLDCTYQIKEINYA